jgi:muconate cycloisomerase
MARIKSFELLSVEIPFKRPFKHAAAERSTSESLFLKCTIASGSIGFGECLPRAYVSGETKDEAFEFLQHQILPNLIGMEFDSIEQLISFLNDCNGKAPQDWVEPAVPQTAAWAAVDLALLDAFGRAFNKPICIGNPSQLDPDFRYSVVISGESGFKALKLLTKIRLYGFRCAKLKVDAEAPQKAARLARSILGKKCDIRADANMAWDVPQAIQAMKALSSYGIYSFEQPLKADDIDGLARLADETGLGVMADESLNDAESLENLIRRKACTAVNVRISKCGGLIAAFNRCSRALAEGLTVQVGCQVGETSLLSAAQLILIAGVKRVTYAEGCFGLHLLHADPFEPLMQFGYGGRPPKFPQGPGLGVAVNEEVLNQYCVKRTVIGPA